MAGALVLAVGQETGKQLAVYSAQAGYALPVAERDGVAYVGLVELLEPLGEVSARMDQRLWRVRFGRGQELQFSLERNRVKIGRQELDLGARLLIENGRGLVPLQAIQAILSALLPERSVEFRLDSRRLFLDKAETRFTAELKSPGMAAQLVLGFSAPVNPVLATESGKTRLTFKREPLRSGRYEIAFPSKVITSLGFSETNGAAELTVNASMPLTAAFSSDHRTITLAPVQPPPGPAAMPAKQAAAPATGPGAATGQANQQAVAPKPPPSLPRFLVIVDAAHGGDEQGAAISDKLAEKDVTLALARRLQKTLEGDGVSVRLLRDADTSMSLDQRAVATNAAVPSLFVTLHASGATSGVRVYSSRLAPEIRKGGFVKWNTAQAGYVTLSQEIAAAISTELLKCDVAATAMKVGVLPINWIATPAVAIEIGPPPGGIGERVAEAQYQQTLATAVATAIAASRGRLPHNEAPR